jgi:hypothetical protein
LARAVRALSASTVPLTVRPPASSPRYAKTGMVKKKPDGPGLVDIFLRDAEQFFD